VAGKGKEVERLLDREQGFKLVKTIYSEPIIDDLTNLDGAGGAPPPLHLHEHHIHYHYYCQHCPPLSQPNNLGEIGEMDDIYGDSRMPAQQVLRHSEGTIAEAAAAAAGRPIRRDVVENGSAEFCASPIDFGRHGFAPIGSPLEDPAAATVAAAAGTTAKKNKKKSILGTMTMTSSMRRRFFAEQNQEQKQQQQQPQQQQSQTPFGMRAGNNSNGNNFSDRGQQQVHGTQRHQVSPILSMGFEKSDGRFGSSSFATMRGKFNQRRRVSLAGLMDQDQFIDEDDGHRLRRQQHLDFRNEFYDEYEEEFGTSTTSTNGRQQQQLQPSADGNPQQQRAKFLSRLKQFLLRPSPFAKNYSSTPPPPPASAPANTNSSNYGGNSSGLPYSSSSSSSAFMTGADIDSGMQDAGAAATMASSHIFTSQHPTDI
jgi:hypothetical protein